MQTGATDIDRLAMGPVRASQPAIRTTCRGLIRSCLAALSFLGIVSGSLCGASEVDFYPDEAWSEPAPFELEADRLRQAEAQARFATGLLEEELEGPDRALSSYLRVLALDPGYLHLAIRVAQEKLRRANIAEAISVVKDAAKALPDDSIPPLILAEIYLRHLQKPALAEEYSQQARKLDPGAFAPIELLWETYQFAGQSNRALTLLEEAATSKSSLPLYWLQLAELHRRLPPDQGAVGEQANERRHQALQKAAGLAAADPVLLARIADNHVLNGEVSEATVLYQQAYELKPDLPRLVEKLAACLVEIRDYEQAIPFLESMLKKNPQSLPVCDQLAGIHLERGDWEEALRYRQRALVLLPTRPERHIDVIELLLRQQKYELAIIYLREAIDRFPRSGIFPYMLAATLTRTGDPVGAVKYFDRALAESATVGTQFITADFYFEFGMAAEQAKMYERAADLFKKAIEIDPANAARASNYLGYMWVDRNENLDEAEALILRALESEPNNGAYVDSLGWLYFRRGLYSEALVTLLRAAELLPEPDSVVYDHIGDTYEKLGRNPEAVLYWQKALQLDPDNQLLVEKIDQSASRVARRESSNSAVAEP